MDKRKMAPVHPGEVLAEDYLADLGITPYRLAKETHMPASRVNAILHGRRAVTADTALRLARYLGGSAVFWLNLQARYDLDIAEDNREDELASITPLTREPAVA